MHRFGTAADAVQAVAMDLTAAAEQAIRLRGRAVMVLGAGPDCLEVYRRWVALAADRPFWRLLVVVLAEQTLVGPDSGRCLGLLQEALLDRVPIATEHRCLVNTSLAPVEAAVEYERMVRMALELRARERPSFDRVVLGVARDARLSALASAEWAARDQTTLVRALPSGIVLTHRALAGTERLILLALGPDRVAAEASWLGPDYALARASLNASATPTACYTAEPGRSS